MNSQKPAALTEAGKGRRSFLRKHVDGVMVECLQRDQAPILGVVNNISIDGIAISLVHDLLKVGDRCRLVVQLLFPRPAVPLEGTVVWKRTREQGTLYGIRIVAVKPDPLELEQALLSEDERFSAAQDRRAKNRRHLSESVPTDIQDKRKKSDRRKPASTSEQIPIYSTPRQFFHDLFDETVELPAMGSRPVSVSLRNFPLFVAGKSLATDKQEYFPFVEQAILDFERTREVITALKSGTVPEDVHKFIYGRYSIGDSTTNHRAMQAAHEAAAEFRQFSLSRRHRILEDIHDLLKEKKEDLINLMVIEGHPRRLAEWEFSGMESSFQRPTLRFFRDEMMREVGKMGSESIYLARKADGVVCVSPPKNAPASISLFAAFCLLPGNSIVIKPPIRTPIACMYLWKEVVQRAAKANGAPDGTVNIITGHSETIMEEWLESPLVNDIFFFGDSKLGLDIGTRAFKKGKKPVLELSGNDFLLIWEDAPLREAAEALLEGFLGSMQICMAPKKAIIHPSVFRRFLDIFVPMVADAVKVGLPSDPRTYLTPVARLRELQTTWQESVAQGATQLLGGRRLNHLGDPDPKGQFAEATLLAIQDVAPLKYRCVAEENFFPLMPLISLPDNHGFSPEDIFKWMTSVVNQNAFGLRTSVWTRSKIWASRFGQRLDNSGLLRINSAHLRFSTFLPPNGGVGRSGGPFGELNYPWAKTSHIQGISAHWPT